MAETSSATRERCRGECHCSRCVGDMAPTNKGKAVEDFQSMESGEVSLAENCYIVENSVADHRILACLERELQAAFRSNN